MHIVCIFQHRKRIAEKLCETHCSAVYQMFPVKLKTTQLFNTVQDIVQLNHNKLILGTCS